MLAFVAPAAAATAVGSANKVSNSVIGSVGNRQLRAADPVFADEAISAASRSHGELLLNDNSRVLVGENSTVVLDKFVVGQGGIEAGTVRVAKGAFRFISAGSGKESLRIATPLATIGVRGTAFDVYVIPALVSGTGADETFVVLLDGQVVVCALNGRCLATQRRCDILRVPTNASVERAPFFLSAARSAVQSAQFNLLYNQQRFDQRWRVPVLACSARAAQEAQNNTRYSNSPLDSFTPPAPDPPDPPEPECCDNY